MAGIMDGFEAATSPNQAPQGFDLTQAGSATAPAQQPIGADVFGPGGYQFREAGYATRNVDRATGTVGGQLDSILAQDGLHMQRARSNALQMAADMGLRNSSIAVGAAQGALIDRATPIATADAQIYNDAARDNQQAANAASLANAGNYNQIGGLLIQERGQDRRLASSQGFTASQSALDRQMQADLQNGRITADALQQQLSRDQQTRIAQLQESGMEQRQAEQIAATERQQREQNVFTADQNVQARQAQMDTLLKQHELTLAQMGYQSQLNNANLPKQFAASIAQQTLDRISAIAGDGNLDAAAKKGAIQNIIDAANATAQLGAKLYGASIPAIAMPGYASVAPVPYAPGTPAYYAPDGSLLPGQAPLASGGVGIMGDGVNGMRNWRLEV